MDQYLLLLCWSWFWLVSTTTNPVTVFPGADFPWYCELGDLVSSSAYRQQLHPEREPSLPVVVASSNDEVLLLSEDFRFSIAESGSMIDGCGEKNP